MGLLRNVLRRFLPRRDRDERLLDAELQDHVERQVADLRASGLSEAEARRRAQLAFGGVDQVKEQCRDARRLRWPDECRQDVRYGVRVLRRAPVFTATVALSLALGIGGVTALFSVFNALLLRPLAVPHPDRLVMLEQSDGKDSNMFFPYPVFERLRTQTRTLSALTAYTGLPRVSVGVRGVAELAAAQLVSGDYFSALQVGAALGRSLGPEDDKPGAQVAMLSDAYWQRRFGGDPAIIGQPITVNQVPFTIVGVLPPGVTSIALGDARDLLLPLRAADTLTPRKPLWDAGDVTWLEVTGRLRDGVSMAQAQADLDALFIQFHQDYVARLGAAERADRGAFLTRLRLRLASAAYGTDARGYRDNLSRAVAVLLLVAGALLLIACLNIATVLLARSAARQREMAVRLALGAGRARLVRQLLTEACLLTVFGGAIGLALAGVAAPLIVRMAAPQKTMAPIDTALDLRVLAFTVGASLAAALFFGLVPALRATRTHPAGALQARAGTGNPVRARVDAALIVSQIALSLVLLVCATLFTRSLHNLGTRATGYDRGQIAMFSVSPQIAGYTGDRVRRTYETLVERLAGLPGVAETAVSAVRPVDDEAYFVGVVSGIDGRPLPREQRIRVAWNAVGPRFFKILRIPMRFGREFDARDRTGAPKVVIISETLARLAFPDQNPIGHTIATGGPNGDTPIEIIGVAGDIRYGSLKDAPRGVVYSPIDQEDLGKAPFAVTYYARTTVPPETMLEPMRAMVRAFDPALPIDRVSTLASQADASLARERVLASLSGYFGGLALLLVCVGLYGLMAYLVVRRTPEFGVRLALGASPGQVRSLILGRATRLIAFGLLLGVPTAASAAQALRALIYDVTPNDPTSFLAAIAALAAGAAAAVWLPARRAARVDPCVALRAD